ncbi:MAG: PQQ-binding-like beta-propeller repeat protein [Chloroflexi bacterium]|nr:PQQ-binding-like beta-propeller repeat protein [Chloroflexota bacterium]
MNRFAHQSLLTWAAVLVLAAVWMALRILRVPDTLRLPEQIPEDDGEGRTVAAASNDGLSPKQVPPPNEGDANASHYWPQWRGPLGTGVAPHANPPVEWSESQNIRWKRELPGKGHSTPVVWGERVFVTTAVPFGEALPAKYSGAPGGHDEVPITHRHKFMVVAVDRRDGKVLWERTVREELPHQGGHRTASLASASPVADGEHLFAHFGSWGLYGLSLSGEVQWQTDLGQLETLHGHGEGSSPALHGETLIVNWDHEGESFVAAFDKRSGRQLWKTPRNRASSWTTPIVAEQDGQPQVIISGSKRVSGYDLATGKPLWECGGLSEENVVSSPVAGHGMVFTGSTYDRPGLLAIRLDGAKGDITGTKQVLWRRSKGAPYVPSPLLYGDSLYFLYHFQGMMTRVNARMGEDQPGPFRLPGIYNVYASPAAAAGRVYVTSREGVTVVLKDGDPPEVLAQNRLEDSFSASAALAGSEMFLRGERFLYCIAQRREID